MLLFFIVPFGIVVYYSVIKNIGTQEYVGLDNYKALLDNMSFQKAAHNTALFSLVAVPLAVVLSLVLAMILERNIPGKSLFRTFFLSPLMVPTASVVLVWQVLFHNHGTVNQIIEHFGGTTFDWLKSDYGQSRSAGCAAAILEHFYRRGIDIFADYKYYPNQVVYHKIFDALSIISNNAM